MCRKSVDVDQEVVGDFKLIVLVFPLNDLTTQNSFGAKTEQCQGWYMPSHERKKSKKMIENVELLNQLIGSDCRYSITSDQS